MVGDWFGILFLVLISKMMGGGGSSESCNYMHLIMAKKGQRLLYQAFSFHTSVEALFILLATFLFQLWQKIVVSFYQSNTPIVITLHILLGGK